MADFTTRRTANGGVVSIHDGAQLTTNIWSSGWYVVDDTDAIRQLKAIASHIKHGLANVAETLADSFLLAYPAPTGIAHPYRRGGGAPRVSRPSAYTTPTATAVPINGGPTDTFKTPASVPTYAPEVVSAEVKQKRHDFSVGLLNFFSEFDFAVSARFTNTLIRQRSLLAAKRYVTAYCLLCDHPDTDTITDKLKSPEFDRLYNEGNALATGKEINSRLEIYFGPQGTGKSSEAISKYPTATVTVCDETKDSHDLMKVFDFNDVNGNPVFKHSALLEDMIAGRPHILDEFNLLPMQSLRFLQGLLDNKTTFDFEGETITIAPGFKIIATMNLVVNGQVFSLPEPIVDRASVLKEFKADASVLESFAF